MAAFIFNEQHVRAFSTPSFLLPSRLSLFRKNFQSENHDGEKRWTEIRTPPSPSSLRRGFERKKNGNYFIKSKGRESSKFLVAETSHDADGARVGRQCGWMMSSIRGRGGGRGGGPRSPPPRVGSKRLSRQRRATVASFFLLFLAKERGRIDEAARALIADTGSLLDASSPRSGTTTLPRRQASRAFSSTQHHQRSGAHARETWSVTWSPPRLRITMRHLSRHREQRRNKEEGGGAARRKRKRKRERGEKKEEEEKEEEESWLRADRSGNGVAEERNQRIRRWRGSKERKRERKKGKRER